MEAIGQCIAHGSRSHTGHCLNRLVAHAFRLGSIRSVTDSTRHVFSEHTVARLACSPSQAWRIVPRTLTSDRLTQTSSADGPTRPVYAKHHGLVRYGVPPRGEEHKRRSCGALAGLMRIRDHLGHRAARIWPSI